MATDHRYQPEGAVGVTGEPAPLKTGAGGTDHRYQPEGAIKVADLGRSAATVETPTDPVSVTGAPLPVETPGVPVSLVGQVTASSTTRGAFGLGGRGLVRRAEVYLSTTGSPTHFPAPTFVDVTSLLLAGDGVTVSQGVSGRGQDWAAGQFSFTLRNTAGTYSGPALLRRPVLLRMAVGGSDIDIRGVITDVTEYRDGVRRLEVSGTDMLGLVADLEVGQTWDEQLKARSTASHWPLVEDGDDDINTTPTYNLSEEPPRDSLGNYIYGGDQSGQTPVYGAIEGCPALSGGGVELEPTGTTGFAGLYGNIAPPGGLGWTIAGWVRRMSGTNGGQVLSVVMSNGYTLGFGFTPTTRGFSYGFMTMYGLGAPTDQAHFMNVLDEYGGPGLPPGQSPWYWITLSMDSGQTIVASACDTRGRQVTEDWSLYLNQPSTPVSLILGGAASVDYGWWLPTHCQIADLTWSTTASGFVSPLIRGHLGYPGEAVSDRGKRLLTEAGLIPAGGTWNGAQPPGGPLCADDPLTRRPLAQALDTALASGGRVLHDLPAQAGVTSIGLLWPAAIDGVGVTPTSYSGKRVLVGADGFATNTGMLTNAATVTNATGAQVSYEDDASVATYKKRAVTVESQSESSDFDASHASWLAHRESTFDRAYALPDLVLDVDGMVADGDTATLVALAKTGACVSIPGILPAGTYTGMVRGLQWQHTPQGAMRLTLRCQALRPLDYAALDSAATATLDNVILGW